MTTTQDRPTEVAKEIGKERRRKEDQRLITGRTRWTDNIVLPGMLHLAMVRSPFAHATITSIEVAAAQASPNVVAVLTGQDLAETQGVLINAWAITTDSEWATTSCISRAIRARSAVAASRISWSRSSSSSRARSASPAVRCTPARRRSPSAQVASTSTAMAEALSSVPCREGYGLPR